MHVRTQTDSETAGGPLNVNKGFLRTKGRKEKREGGKEKGWEKPTFLKELRRSKEFDSQRPRSQGVTTRCVRNPEGPLQSGNPSRPFDEGDEQLGLPKRDAVQKWRRRRATGGETLCARVACLGLGAHLALQATFCTDLLKDLPHGHEAQTLRQHRDN